MPEVIPSEPLRACPFCGKQPKASQSFVQDTDEPPILAACWTEGCPLAGLPFDIAAWNRRADDEVFAAIRAELIRARKKFPGNAHLTVALTEEVGEVAEAYLNGTCGLARGEAIHVACVAVRIATEGDGDFEPNAPAPAPTRRRRKAAMSAPEGSTTAIRTALARISRMNQEIVIGTDVIEALTNLLQVAQETVSYIEDLDVMRQELSVDTAAHLAQSEKTLRATLQRMADGLQVQDLASKEVE